CCRVTAELIQELQRSVRRRHQGVTDEGGRGTRKVEVAVEIATGDLGLDTVQAIDETRDADVTRRLGRVQTRERKQHVALERDAVRFGERQRRGHRGSTLVKQRL